MNTYPTGNDIVYNPGDGDRPRRSKRATFAYTMLEMLAVLLIVSLLVTAVVGLYWHAQEATHRRRAMADLGYLQHALQQFQLHFGRYPYFGMSDAVDVTALFDNSLYAFDLPETYSMSNSLPSGFTAIDPWQNPYQYQIEAARAETYRLFSLGRGGKDNPDEYITFQP